MLTQTRTGFQRHTDHLTEDPFHARFGHRLPQGLRDEAEGMSWRTFMETYCPSDAARIQNVQSTPQPGFTQRYHAAIANTGMGREVTASGPISACTQMLAEWGRPVEIIKFHQCDIFEATVTFILATHQGERVWAMGFGPDRANSGAAAMSHAAHRLHVA